MAKPVLSAFRCRASGLAIALLGLLALPLAPALAAPITYVSTDVPKAISAGPPSTIHSTLSVPDAFIIDSLTVQLRIRHEATTDLDLYLIGPTGLTVELSTDNGGAATTTRIRSSMTTLRCRSKTARLPTPAATGPSSRWRPSTAAMRWASGRCGSRTTPRSSAGRSRPGA